MPMGGGEWATAPREGEVFINTEVSEAQKIAALYILEYQGYSDEHGVWSSTQELSGDLNLEIPQRLMDVVEACWDSTDLPLTDRPSRVFMLIRETITSFMKRGRFVLYPGRTLALDTMTPDFQRRRAEAYELDASIRAAVNASDLMEEWASSFGPQRPWHPPHPWSQHSYGYGVSHW